jgi:hypothetical protein
MAEQIIKTAEASDEASIVAVVVLAFSADPAARWAWPDPQQYLRHFTNFVEALGGKAFAHGSAYYAEGYSGAAMWLPPEVSPDEDMLAELLQRTGYAPVQKDVFAVFEQMAHYHPSQPHWFLPFIGVDPHKQRRRQFFQCSANRADRLMKSGSLRGSSCSRRDRAATITPAVAGRVCGKLTVIAMHRS